MAIYILACFSLFNKRVADKSNKKHKNGRSIEKENKSKTEDQIMINIMRGKLNYYALRVVS